MAIIKAGLWSDAHTNTPGRVEEAHRVHEAMLESWRARDVDFIGFAGDWNEVPPNEQDQAWSRDFLGRCAEVAPTIVIYGNHDGEGVLDEFHMQSEHKYPITVVSRPDVIVVDTKAGKLAVACVPFVWKAHLLAQLGPLSIEESDLAAQEQLAIIFRGLGVRVRELGLPSVGLVHGMIRGSRINEEQPARPLGMDLPLEDLAQVNVPLTICGHIHLQQHFSYNGQDFVVPGSPFFVDWGEAKYQKGYVWANISESGVEWERIATPVVPMLLVEWDYDPTSPVSFRSRKETTGKIDFTGCDVRLRFHFPKDAEKIAKRAAEANAERIREAGAVNVTLDPVPDPAIRSRIPELSEAVTLEAKAQLYRDSTEAKVEGDEQAILDRYLQEIQDELANEGVSFGLQSRAVPALKRLRGKGWLCFPNEFDVDLEKMQGPLTAVIAPNESGKTVLLNLAGPGLMYGDTVDRGSLDDLSRARDSFIEGTFEMNGADHVLSQICDGQARKGMVTLSKDSKPLLQKAGRAEYAAWAKTNLLPWNQYLALLFHSGTEDDGGKKINIIEMKDAARTELMLRVVGIEYYETIAKRARDKSSAVTSKLGETNARLDELKSGQTIAFCEQSLLRATDEKRVADEALRLSELTLKDLQDKNAANEKLRTEHGAMVARRRELESQEQKLQARIAELDQLITNCQTVLSEKATIEAAAEDVKNLTAALADLKTGESELRVQLSEAQGRAREKRQELQRLNDKLAGLNRNIESANRILADKDKILAAVENETNARSVLANLESAQESAWREVEKVQSQGVVSLEGRLDYSLDAHRVIAAGNADRPSELSQDVLDVDGKAKSDAKEHPTKLAEAKTAWQESKSAVDRQRVHLESIARLAGRAPEIKDAEQMVAEATQEIAELRSLSEELPIEIRAADSAIAEIETALTSKTATAAVTQREIDGLTPLAAKASRIEEAQTKIGLRREERETVATEREAVLESLSRVITDTVEPPPLIPLGDHESAVSQARTSAQSAQTSLAIAERELDAAKGRETRKAELTARADDLTRQIDRWNRLAREWGVDGLQKEECANLGPKLTELTNELLRAGGDTRHTVDIRTERPHSREKRLIPCFDILVRDSAEGQDKESRRLSGAGKLIVGKPLIMAMNILACERAGVKSCTIFEDELTGPADPENAIKIVGMLRYFADRLNARILYVSQDPDIQALADSAVKILPGGQIAVT